MTPDRRWELTQAGILALIVALCVINFVLIWTAQ